MNHYCPPSKIHAHTAQGLALEAKFLGEMILVRAEVMNVDRMTPERGRKRKLFKFPNCSTRVDDTLEMTTPQLQEQQQQQITSTPSSARQELLSCPRAHPDDRIPLLNPNPTANGRRTPYVDYAQPS
jgi:hypothetical protein